MAHLEQGSQVLNVMNFQKEFEVPLKTLLPVIIGCTSEIKTEDLLHKCEGEGFRFLANAPLKPDELAEMVYPLLHIRQKDILVNNFDLMVHGLEIEAPKRRDEQYSFKKRGSQRPLPSVRESEDDEY